ncbi:MAG: histidine kinase dimerization/phosphoacceptor domain -containing protein [Thermodesulfobacteriota bacterium]
MSKPDYLGQELFKISRGKRGNSRKVRLQSRDRKYNRKKFDYKELSFDCVGDLAFWLDSDTKFLRVNKAACVFSGSSQSRLGEMTNYDIGPNYPKESTSFPGCNPERRKTRKGESGGIELRVTKQTRRLFEKNRELKKEIAKRKLAEEEIRTVLSEKDLLLKEVQHRLKNNLQFITTLLDIHSDYTNDNKMQNVLVDIQNRIKSMALIHEQIYQSKSVAKIDFKEYLKNLVSYIFDSYGISRRAIKPKITGSDCSLSVKSVINCGLIANELISNALKHGFPNGRQGVIFINMYSEDNNFKLIIGDNGIGFPKNFSFQNITTLGLQLVISLTHQLNGGIKLNRRGRTEFKIVFPEN